MVNKSPNEFPAHEQPIHFGASATPFEAVKNARQFIQLSVDSSKGLSRRRYGWHSNNTLFDSTHFTSDDGRGVIDIETGATGGDTARIRSAITGRYVSQTVAQPGVGMHIDSSNVTTDQNNRVSLTHGTVAVGAGWHDGSSGGWGVGGPVQTFLGLTYDDLGAEAVLISNGSHIGGSPVNQRDWNLDPMDGTGPSGRVLDPSHGYVYNFPYTWYGYGALYVGVVDPTLDRTILVHKFDPDGPTLDRPNLAPMCIVDNGGTGSALNASIGGLQYTLYGANLSEEGGEERGVEEARVGLSITQSKSTNNGAVDPNAEPGQPIICVKRGGGVRDLSLKVTEVNVTPDADMYLFAWDEYEPAAALTDENFREPSEVVNSSESKVLVDTEATDYSPQTAVARGLDFVSTQKNQESLISLSTDDRIPIDAARIITAVNDGTNADLNPAQIRVVEGY